MKRPVDDQPPCFLGEGYTVFTGLTLRPIEVDVDLAFERFAVPLTDREGDDIRDVVVAKETAVDAANEPASDKHNRDLTRSDGLIL